MNTVISPVILTLLVSPQINKPKHDMVRLNMGDQGGLGGPLYLSTAQHTCYTCCSGLWGKWWRAGGPGGGLRSSLFALWLACIASIPARCFSPSSLPIPSCLLNQFRWHGRDGRLGPTSRLSAIRSLARRTWRATSMLECKR